MEEVYNDQTKLTEGFERYLPVHNSNLSGRPNQCDTL